MPSMPSPSTPQRPSNRGSARSAPTKTRAVDIGESQGQHDTRDVREKIRKWHSEGGGVVVTPDVGASSEEEQKPAETKPQETRQRTKRTRARRRGTTRVPRGDEDRRDILNSSAPKKRVISDGHWRKNRATPNSGSTSSSPQKRMESASTKYDQTRALFEERIERAKKEATKRASANAQLDDGIKVYAGPLKSSKSSGSRGDRSGSDQDTWENNDGSIVEKKKKTTPKKKHGSKRRSSRDNLKKKESAESGNKSYKDSIARHEYEWSTPPSDTPKSPKQKRRSQSPRRRKKPSAQLAPPKGGIFKPVIEAIDGSKKFFAKPEPPPEPIRGSRVEAWLSGTPDPFVEERSQLAERPAPPKSPSRRRPAPKTEESDSGHCTQLLDETPENSRRRRSRRSRKRHGSSSSSEKKDTNKENEYLPKPPKIPSREREGSPGSESGLRRSGARKRPQSMHDDKKMSTLRESVEEALRESNPDRPCSSDGSDISHMERPPPLTLRRPFAGTGMHRLSTIPSVDTLATSNDSQTPTVKAHSREGSALAVPPEQDDNLESESRDHFDANSLLGPATCRRPTRHSDLMSVLSGPVERTRSIRSARSIRTNRSRLATATVGDLMRELASDEASYMRELRTLVGGVIPVLLTSVLSKTESAVAAGLFRPSSSPKDDDNFTRPIINMGVSLERLKALHKRIPLDNSDALLSWAQGAKKVYADYLKAWRLGFQDVVVNLAPPDADDPNSQDSDTRSLWDGMSQDENGDVVDGDGERVDVAFLLKRPLVRLKYLSKTFKGLNYIQMSPKTEEISLTYRALVVDARRRANEERARLEDDTAAAIDATRCRDLLTLGVSENVTVDKKRRVRARDYFDLSLLHSTGQQIDCHSELLLRDNPAEKGPGGDLFISEVDHKGRWLLFPPIERERLSARRGDDMGEIVIMVRERLGESEKWYELFSFKTDEEDICLEWVEMLGINPLPPKIDVDSIKERKRTLLPDQETLLLSSISTDKAPSSTTSGEPTTTLEQTAFHAKQQSEEARNLPLSPPSNSTVSRGRSRRPQPTIIPPSTPTKHNEVKSPIVLTEAMDLASVGSPTNLKRTKAQRRKSKGPPSPQTPAPTSPAPKAEPGRFYKQHPASEPAISVESSFTDSQPVLASPVDKTNPSQGKRPIASVVKPTRRAHSPVPSLELPKIERLRKRDPTASTVSSPTRSEVNGDFDFSDEEDPIWPSDNEDDAEDAPEPPPHRTPTRSSQKSRLSGSLVLSPPTPQFARHRRTSSPLKHEYEPSTATESSPSETSTVEHYEMFSESETSEDELEDDDIDTPLPPIRGRHINATSPPKPILEDADDTLAPSNSASQAPYRTVPAQSSRASEATAAVWYWNDGPPGSYKLLKSGCHIVVTPGLIEAFETDKAEKRPLISLELTPMVGIRRGTGVDICIDSPPTERATFNRTGNIMFRPSTNPEDANRLYNLINHSRMNNPTYIALQNARGPFTSQPTPPVRQNSVRSTRFSGMFSLGGLSRKKSYRASAIAPPSTGLSESSIGTVSSAFSALKKFGANNKMFNVARSTLRSRTGSRGGSLYSTSTRSGDDYSPTSEPIDASNAAVGSIGLSNAKIRLYIRESQKRWGDLGRARLTILPVSPPGSRPGTSSATSKDSNGDYVSPDGSGFANEGVSASNPAGPPSPLRNPAREEKRILIHSKKDEAVLLDACLGESCFERIGRTGIAVSVWEEFDEVAKEGGVVGGSFRVYMIQMKNVAEAAYTFNIVGKNRY